MKSKNEKVVILLLVVAVVGIGLLTGLRIREWNYDVLTKEVKVISFSTNKDSYEEGETAVIEAVIYSSERRDVVVKVHGIKSNYGREYLTFENATTLMRGENRISFSYTLPYCNRCAGLPPGIYSLSLELLENNTTIGMATKTISLGSS